MTKVLIWNRSNITLIVKLKRNKFKKITRDAILRAVANYHHDAIRQQIKGVLK